MARMPPVSGALTRIIRTRDGQTLRTRAQARIYMANLPEQGRALSGMAIRCKAPA
jgi:hypothetical protein